MMGPIGLDFLDAGAGAGAAGVAATVAPLAEMSCSLCRSVRPLQPRRSTHKLHAPQAHGVQQHASSCCISRQSLLLPGRHAVMCTA